MLKLTEEARERFGCWIIDNSKEWVTGQDIEDHINTLFIQVLCAGEPFLCGEDVEYVLYSEYRFRTYSELRHTRSGNDETFVVTEDDFSSCPVEDFAHWADEASDWNSSWLDDENVNGEN